MAARARTATGGRGLYPLTRPSMGRGCRDAGAAVRRRCTHVGEPGTEQVRADHRPTHGNPAASASTCEVNTRTSNTPSAFPPIVTIGRKVRFPRRSAGRSVGSGPAAAKHLPPALRRRHGRPHAASCAAVNPLLPIARPPPHRVTAERRPAWQVSPCCAASCSTNTRRRTVLRRAPAKMTEQVCASTKAIAALRSTLPCYQGAASSGMHQPFHHPAG